MFHEWVVFEFLHPVYINGDSAVFLNNGCGFTNVADAALTQDIQLFITQVFSYIHIPLRGG